jgi:tetratricopeptide (TPR) repeat protein
MILALLLLCLSSAPATLAAEDVQAEYARAVALQQSGDYEEAVAAYRALRAREQTHVGAWSNLGAALAALGRFDEAVAAYGRALALAPGDPRILYNLALAHYKAGDFDRAAEVLTTLREAAPGDPRATLLLADCRLRLGEWAAVEALLDPVLAAEPDNAAALYLEGMALVRDGRVEEGQRVVERLMRQGTSAEAHYLLGSVAFMARDYPQAVRELGEALALDPALPSLRSYYGRALLFTGDARGAEKELRAAVAEAPNDYEAHYFLASILATLRRPDEARPFAERAATLRPRSEEARELLASLDAPTPAVPVAGDVSPLVGHEAPDVELRRSDGSTLRLSSLRGEPVVVVIGSYTCPQLRNGAPAVNELYARLGDRARFLFVYIREAHPEGDGWQSTVNAREGVSLPDARTLEERAEHAALCRRRLDIAYEAVLDGMDDAVEKAWSAFPSRVFVVDASGRVTFSSALDMETFRPEALEAAVRALIGGADASSSGRD